MSIALRKLLSYLYHYRTYEKGVAYFNSGRIAVIEDSGYEVYGAAYGSDGNIYEWTLGFEDDRQAINLGACYCECPAFAEYPGLCKHLVAAVLACNDIEKKGLQRPGPDRRAADVYGSGPAEHKSKPAFVTTGASYELLQSYARRAYRTAERSGKKNFRNSAPVRLEPTLRYDPYDGLRVSFRIGTGRLFVVKNLNELRKSIATDDVITLGKNSDVRVGREYFDEESAPLADFISLYAESKSGYDYSAESRKEIDLRGAALDSFFEVYAGDTIGIERKNRYIYGSKEKSKLHIVRSSVRIPVTIARVNGGIEVSGGWNYDGASVRPALLRGAVGTHILSEDSILICDAAFSEACTDFLEVLLSTKLRYADRDAPAFFSAVFKSAQPYLDVTYEKDEVSDLIPPGLETSVYFDTTEEGFVTARMIHRYGSADTEAFGEKSLDRNYDIKGEVRVEKMLTDRIGYEIISPGTIILRDEEAIFDLINEGIPELAEICEIYASESFERIKVRPPTVVSVGLSVNHDLLEMDIDLEGIDFKELAGVLEQYRLKKKYKRLPDGSFLPIGESDSMAQLAELCSGAEISADELAHGHVTMGLDRVLYVDSVLRGSETLRYERDESFRNIIRAMRDVDDSDYDVPGGINGVLRNYQITGFKWLCTLAALTGSRRERIAALSHTGDYDLYVTSYGQMMRDIEDLGEVRFGCAVLDEAQFALINDR